MDDREVVAAIAAGSPEGIAAAYDEYAASLYGYCHWMLHGSADAAEALRDAFVLVAAAPDDLPEAAELRPWLYSVVRTECLRRLQTRPDEAGQLDEAGGEPTDATMSFRAIDQPAGPAGQPTDATMVFGAIDQPAGQPADATVSFRAVSQDSGRTELRTLVSDLLAELKPREREVIELHLRHDLHDADLAIALGVSWSEAHHLASRATGRLEKALGALLVARTGREACPELDGLLADWDGHLSQETRELLGRHIERCETCTGHRHGALRPAAFSSLLPLAPLPAPLREQVLRLCSSGTPGADEDQRQVNRRADSVWPARLAKVARLVPWARIRAHPGPVVATVVVVAWVVAAASVTLLTFVHSARALPVRPSIRPSSSSTAAVASPTALATVSSPAASPSPTTTRSRTVAPSPVQSAPAFIPASSSPSSSVKPSTSASPKPSKSPSSSRTTFSSPSSSASVSPSPLRT